MTRRILRLVGTLLAVGAVALALALVVVPRVTGWVPLTILSGSMEPTIPVGSQVIVEPVEDNSDVARLQIGDVITFMPKPDDATLVTHRVVTRSVGSDGVVTLTTQGDANDNPDEVDLTTQQVRGVMRYHVPLAGYVAQALDGQQKSIATVALAGGLVLYAGMELLLAGRDRRRARDADRPTGEQADAQSAEQATEQATEHAVEEPDARVPAMAGVTAEEQ
ncbi:hypothetical protein GCM10023169_01310 [Georgenia halophila]|uniref:Signal peptidase I n=1 Tax=Georgenia halophila TaxID=620889 RepID=A0ABP8KUA2_9MICO